MSPIFLLAAAAIVHLDGPSGARLESFDRATDRWASACTAPCDEKLSLTDEYRVVDGQGEAIGDTFRLEWAPDQTIVVHVRPPEKQRRLRAVAVIVVAVLGGGIFPTAAPSPKPFEQYQENRAAMAPRGVFVPLSFSF